ncbi:MAG TPA: gluconate 2-dehydrogenase subunit 3 family protein [Acidobacteriaceae bacterium]|nr:gluconate 2-dehydrogenase subunit 3 family protein [Acidobacteriaceae bacterium]
MSKNSFPRDPKTGKAIRNLSQPGYYPGYSTLGQRNAWDETTRKTVVERVHSHEEIRFFSPHEAELLSAVADRLIPQDDRADDRTIPILPSIDERLYKNQLNGFRYEDMPPDREAYRLGLHAIDEMSQQRFQLTFIALPVFRQELLLKSLHDGKPDPPHPAWKHMPVHRFWAMLMEDCATAYYSHPWSWDEIGFGGPAYPRAYTRLENGLPEPWEKDETRYEWNAPEDSVSEIDIAGAPPERSPLHGHGGTH